MTPRDPQRCPLCDGPLELAFRYDRPPAGETEFAIPPERYRREYRRCRTCGHFAAAMALDLVDLYGGEYVDATYTDGGIGPAFNRIMSLPPERSDNAQRVARVVEQLESAGRAGDRTVLDVGSGLGVFAARMKQAGWRCTALDPDPRACDFARAEIGVEAICADFMTHEGSAAFDLVTFNKVLEHVEDPLDMLRHSRRLLREGGTVYVEVPDGELAAADPDGPNREEFFIEHLCVFSLASLALLAARAGFQATRLERLREPSGKYTLFGFLAPPASGVSAGL